MTVNPVFFKTSFLEINDWKSFDTNYHFQIVPLKLVSFILTKKQIKPTTYRRKSIIAQDFSTFKESSIIAQDFSTFKESSIIAQDFSIFKESSIIAQDFSTFKESIIIARSVKESSKSTELPIIL